VEHVIRNTSIDDADAIGAVVVRAWQAAYRASCPTTTSTRSESSSGPRHQSRPGPLGRGLGQTLLAEVTQGLADVGYQTAVLWVVTGNERARRLYESDGWTAEGPARDVEVLGVTVNEVHYRKRLDS
jgi:hypothetical protein